MFKNYSLLLLFLLQAAGCDLFDTRNSEPPVTPRSNSQFATSYEVLMDNFFTSISEKNADNYLLNFADSLSSGFSYNFKASSNATLIYPVFSGEWGIYEEDRYFRNFISELGTERKINISLTDSVTTRYGDSALFLVKYSLTVPPVGGSALLSYSGEMRLRMKVNKNLIWKIYLWEDYKTTSIPSWSDLKGEKY